MAQTKNRYSKPKFLATFGALILLLSGISHVFGLSTLKHVSAGQAAHTTAAPAGEPQAAIADTGTTQLADLAVAYSTEPEAEPEPEADLHTESPCADTGFVSAKVWSYPDCFPDSNSVQLQAARLNGVAPMNSRSEVLNSAGRHQLSNISSSPYYVMDDLTHSMPYLVPKAQLLLNTIGINFVDSLHSKGMALHLPIVTSVLRTNDDIRRLQHGNSNSVTNSCHCYGTTIDITYNRFMPVEGKTPTRYDETLKKVLAEVLYDLRADGRCYVKYERRQACFHLTVI